MHARKTQTPHGLILHSCANMVEETGAYFALGTHQRLVSGRQKVSVVDAMPRHSRISCWHSTYQNQRSTATSL